jgi:sulfite oxidase
VAIACAGNRRKQLKKVYDVKGLDWDVGAIGNNTYRGVLIKDLLLLSGF